MKKFLKFNYKLSTLLLLLIISEINAQVNEPSKSGENSIDSKLKKYQTIDTISRDALIKANLENRILDFTIYRTEGEITINNKEKKIYGVGGLEIYCFLKKDSKLMLKIENDEVKHIYSDEGLKNYLNSEIRKTTIFFNENGKPDFAIINENHYTSEKVLSSERYFLNLSEEENYYKNSATKVLIEYVLEIANQCNPKNILQK